MRTTGNKCRLRLVLLGALVCSASWGLAADGYQLIVSGTWPVPPAATVKTVEKSGVTIGSCDERSWIFDLFTSIPMSGLILTFR